MNEKILNYLNNPNFSIDENLINSGLKCKYIYLSNDDQNKSLSEEDININVIKFPDGQIHTNINLDFLHSNFVSVDIINVVCSLKTSDDIIKLIEVSNILNNYAISKILSIKYLWGARYDRVMVGGDSLDLKIISNIINNLNYDKVIIYDVHNPTTTMALINNCIIKDNTNVVNSYNIENSILICPDVGASKNIKKYLDINPNLVDVVYSIKERNPKDGSLKIKVLDPEKCKDRNCVIIDDLCDGGGTFIGIAEQIEPKYLTLCISHGIFSKGLDILFKYFDSIITTDSYCSITDTKYNLKIINSFDKFTY